LTGESRGALCQIRLGEPVNGATRQRNGRDKERYHANSQFAMPEKYGNVATVGVRSMVCFGFSLNSQNSIVAVVYAYPTTQAAFQKMDPEPILAIDPLNSYL